MKKFLVIASIALCSLAVMAAEPQKVSLSVDPQRIQHRIDPRVYGQFLELIYHSCNGGLWGDIVWNRSFDVLPGGGRWLLEGQEIVQRSPVESDRLIFGDRTWADYEFTLQALKSEGDNGFVLFFRAKSNGDFYRANIAG